MVTPVDPMADSRSKPVALDVDCKLDAVGAAVATSDEADAAALPGVDFSGESLVEGMSLRLTNSCAVRNAMRCMISFVVGVSRGLLYQPGLVV